MQLLMNCEPFARQALEGETKNLKGGMAYLRLGWSTQVTQLHFVHSIMEQKLVKLTDEFCISA